MKRIVLAIVLLGLFFGSASLAQDQCEGSQICHDGERISCRVNVPFGGSCTIQYGDLGLACYAYDESGDMVDRDTPMCWPEPGGSLGSGHGCGALAYIFPSICAIQAL